MTEILIVAGELSGDAHAARVLHALKSQLPELTAWGYGGDLLAAEGMEIREHIRDLSVMGIWEVLKRYGYFKKIFAELLEEIESRKPDLVLLVDYPGFNLRLAEKLAGKGIPVIQYICPQVWAWKKNRIPKMDRVLDGLICIFPFEKKVFQGYKLPVHYCGHPMVEETMQVSPGTGWKDGPKLALVPGSRLQEIERIFLPMMESAQLLQQEVPGLQIRIPAADKVCETKMHELLEAHPELPKVEIVPGQMRALVKGADAALVTSGTATLETCLLGTPMIIVYKTSALTYAIGKRVIKVPYIGMVNLVAEREVCKEFIQHEATPEAMSTALRPLLSETKTRDEMLAGLAEVRERLIADDGGARVADVLLPYLQKDPA
ncbi:lipid-A-disaccharide synthase [Kiritimatiellota bacterium B12222]|nr:lipid-A-disaccharide synthase [Kiritimatiellota bacterium B12222]